MQLTQNLRQSDILSAVEPQLRKLQVGLETKSLEAFRASLDNNETQQTSFFTSSNAVNVAS